MYNVDTTMKGGSLATTFNMRDYVTRLRRPCLRGVSPDARPASMESRSGSSTFHVCRRAPSKVTCRRSTIALDPLVNPNENTLDADFGPIKVLGLADKMLSPEGGVTYKAPFLKI